MKRVLTLRWLAIVSPHVVTTFIWVLAKLSSDRPTGFLQAVGQLTGLYAIILMATALIIAARSRTVERIYGGLDKSYRIHVQLGKIAFGLMLVHPILLIPSYLEKGLSPALLFWFGDFAPRNWGIAAYYSFILLIGLTLWRFLEYQKWFSLHRWLGLPFLAASLHTLGADSDVKAFWPLRDWVLFWLILGSAAWVYKAFAYSWLAKRYRYQVESIVPRGRDMVEVGMIPVGRKMAYEPGEFAFFSVRGNPKISPESHPFSLGSNPAKRSIRICYGEVGDYTRSLRALEIGDAIEVYGPYGEFSSYVLDEFKKQVWIAGRTGIAPFLSMLAYEATNEDNKEVTLIYGVKKSEDAVYAAEIESMLEDHEDHLHFAVHTSDDQGFMTADYILGLAPDDPNQAYLFCGPPIMMKNLKKQLMARGVPASRIFFEDFSFV